jgi:hypothetical protein
MLSTEKYLIITTINPPNERLKEYQSLGYNLVIVGDTKSDDSLWEQSEYSDYYLSYADQKQLYPELSELIGERTYARKNIGYLYAASKGAKIMWETDDDTFPRMDVGDPLKYIDEKYCVAPDGVNVWNPYDYFAEETKIWPRGLPLGNVLHPSASHKPFNQNTNFSILQTLVNLEPDVDAIFRLTQNYEPMHFSPTRDVVKLLGDTLTPANTQSTFWVKREDFVWMYFPKTVSNRMGDILKMYIAQKHCELAYAGFLTEQIRNEHDFMVDFKEEVPLYLSVDSLLDEIMNLKFETLSQIYENLSALKICDPAEVHIADSFERTMKSVLS